MVTKRYKFLAQLSCIRGEPEDGEDILKESISTDDHLSTGDASEKEETENLFLLQRYSASTTVDV